jgi:hypothetical protein
MRTAHRTADSSSFSGLANTVDANRADRPKPVLSSRHIARAEVDPIQV